MHVYDEHALCLPGAWTTRWNLQALTPPGSDLPQGADAKISFVPFFFKDIHTEHTLFTHAHGDGGKQRRWDQIA